jgi:hypothetical protein
MWRIVPRSRTERLGLFPVMVDTEGRRGGSGEGGKRRSRPAIVDAGRVPTRRVRKPKLQELATFTTQFPTCSRGMP